MNNQQKEILNLMDKNNLDAMLLYSPQNRYWYSRFQSSLGFLLITKKGGNLFLDGRYITAARNSKQLININNLDTFKNVWDELNKIIKNKNLKKIGFEADWLKYLEYQNFSKQLKAEFIPVNCDYIRMIKDEFEIKNIKKACDITNLVFEEVLNFAKPGMSEKDLARFVSDSFLKNGAEKLSFDTIVASGINGSMPHAVPSDKKLANNELITLDMGCYFNGYCSDQTRTFAIGQISDELKQIYNIVYEAQQLAINALKPGINSSEVHKIAFDYIESKGYGQYFTHGTGHGLGVEIHEQPYNSVAGNIVLEEGMCVTVEPGIYIPELGGVRIEDDLLITSNGFEYLTTSNRELIIK